MTILAEKVKDGDLDVLESNQGPLSCSCGDVMRFGRIGVTFHTPSGDIQVTDVPCHRCSRCGEIAWNGLVEIRVEELAWEAMQRRQPEVRFRA